MIWCVALLVTFCVLTSDARHAYVVGGHDAEVGGVPWQVSLETHLDHTCGGALIGSNFVLTAAHCVAGLNVDWYSIVVGLHDRSDWSVGNPTRHSIAEIVVHPNYGTGDGRYPNDIALLKLDKQVDLSDNSYAEVIPMADSVEEVIGGTGVISGWGITEIQGVQLAETLQTAEVTFITNQQCATIWGNHYVNEGNVCAYEAYNATACMGDRGGPLVSDAAQPLLYGINSFGSESCYPHFPGVFSSVPYFREWIKSTTGI